MPNPHDDPAALKALQEKNITDRDEGRKEVRRRLDRLCRVHDANRFTTEPPKVA